MLVFDQGRAAAGVPGALTASSAHAHRTSALWPFALLGLAALIARILFMTGPFGSDDTRYFEFAEELLRDGAIDRLDHAASRLVLLLVVAGPGVLWDNIYVAATVNVVISVVTDVLVVWWVWKAYGHRAALLVAVVSFTHGLVATYAGVLTPDPLLTLLMVASVMLLDHGSTVHGAKSVRWPLLAGVAAGLAYSAKDTGLLLVPPLGAYILFFYPADARFMQRVLHGVALGIGFTLVWLGECLTYWALAGDFFYKMHAIASVHNAGVVPAAGLVDFVRHGWWNFLVILGDPVELAIPLLAGAVAGVWAIATRHRTALWALVLGFVGCYLVFGSSSLVRLVNLPFQERYPLALLPFALVPLAAWLAPRLERMKSAPAVLAALALVLGAVGVVKASERAGELYFAAELRNAAEAVASVPQIDTPVFVESILCKQLRFFLPADRYAHLRCITAWEDLNGQSGYLVIPTQGRLLPKLELHADQRPQDWRLVARIAHDQRNVARLFGKVRPSTDASVALYTK